MNAIFYSGLLSFVIALAVGPTAIRSLRRLKAGQQVREAGPKSHQTKSGTPTMGGVIMLIGIVLATLLTASQRSTEAFYLVVVLIGFGLIGVVDDYMSVTRKRSLGLKARYKLIAQCVIALAAALYALNASGLRPELVVPFSDATWAVSPLLFLALGVGTIVGAANAVNFTDGLDGLAAGASAIAGAVYSAICWKLGHPDAAVFAAALAGACLGFSWYNAHPAQVFMGDTGSLALGGALGALAVLTHTQLPLLIVGGLFVIETLSIMIQVTYFRLTKGKRIFRMSPIHHHFELGGWAETQVVMRFWLIALLCGIVGLMAVV